MLPGWLEFPEDFLFVPFCLFCLGDGLLCSKVIFKLKHSNTIQFKDELFGPYMLNEDGRKILQVSVFRNKIIVFL